ncbi:hypothetical protein WOC76_12260 [Methylocystis sp. IM3]|jgi:hypothetical protein|uniref:hypothetical protein n=1 Tax=unclassified Methylocystis TaxID=2625913 RepID=UPI002686ECEE
MRLFLAALGLAFALAGGPAWAQSDAQHELDAIFQLFDEDHDGFITTAEANRVIERTFAEMDGRKTGEIKPEDWMRFSFGLADLAAAQGRSDAYDRAKYEIFKRWDRRGAGALTLDDYRAGVLGDARKGLAAGRSGEGRTGEAMRLDLAAFKRAPFVRRIMKSLH